MRESPHTRTDSDAATSSGKFSSSQTRARSTSGERPRPDAATWYQSDRDQAAVRLAAAGLSNIEAEPQDLSAALVSAYFDIKERAAL